MPASRRAAALLAAAGVLVILPWATEAAWSDDSPLAFTATAGGSGLRIALTSPGAPLTDVLLDSGGPVAQVGASSIDQATAYASFPDPGPLVNGLPGLVAGIAGLQGLVLPTLPAYPFTATADGIHPDATLGSGPYAVEAHSDGQTGRASATVGLASDVVGHAGLLQATATVEASDDLVRATGTSTIDAVTIGPLSIGRVTSTATMELRRGAATPAARGSVRISGVSIGGVAVDLTADGLDVVGSAVPLPIGPALSQLLAGSGITVEVLPKQTFADRVIAPAIRLHLPVDESVLGARQGEATVVLGGATASLTGAEPDEGGPDLTAPAGPGADVAAVLGVPAGGGELPDLSTPAGPAAPAAVAGAPIAAEGRPAGAFDLRSLYLLCAAAALSCWVAAQLTRLLGARTRWTSTTG